MATAIILMGVSGCGKTSVGKGLSETLDWPFYDGDDFHPQANIDKMAQGIPLNDDDRQPWLERLHALTVECLDQNRSLIVASSALKAKYRQTLRGDRESVKFVHLVGTLDLIFARMQQRSEHYMKAEMLRSQFADLELPKHALTVRIDKPVSEIVAEIIENLQLVGTCR
jgi:carbohydrate kinase (thermoresistant glucokinase family)